MAIQARFSAASRPCRILRGALLSAAASLAAPSEGSAQQRSSLAGYVRDSTGAPIERAEIRIAQLGLAARSNENGLFVFGLMPVGEVTIAARRVGFAPAEGTVRIGEVDTLTITLFAQQLALDPVVVEERRSRSWMEPFEYRRSVGIGLFITRDELEARNTVRPSDVLRDKPGLRMLRLPGGGYGVRFIGPSQTRLPGRVGGTDCQPMIWLDGQRAPGMEIDDIPAVDIEAMELYRGVSTTPSEFAYPPPRCGTIVVWTRLPGNAERRARNP